MSVDYMSQAFNKAKSVRNAADRNSSTDGINLPTQSAELSERLAHSTSRYTPELGPPDPSGGAGVPGLTNRLLGLFTDHYQSLVNAFTVVTILLLETFSSRSAFVCPCGSPNRREYAAAFMLSPALVLLVIGLLSNNSTWWLVTGCFYRSPESRHGLSYTFRHVSEILAQASVAPLSWLFFVLIDGTVYTCMRSTDPCSSLNNDAKEHAHLKAVSQTLGLVGLTVYICVTLLVLILSRAMSRMTQAHHNYVDTYRKMERLEMQNQFEEHAQTVAMANVRSFINKETRSKLEWDRLAVITTPSRENARTNGYELLSSTPLCQLIAEEGLRKMGRPIAQTQTSFENAAGLNAENVDATDCRLPARVYQRQSYA